MKASLTRRVQRLEQRCELVQPPPLSAEDLLFQKKLPELVARLDEKYASIVLQDLAHPLREASNLTLAVCERVIDHVDKNSPLEFPKEVAEVYLSPQWSSSTQCQQCGYAVPWKNFEACPLCGKRLWEQA
jgi:hypothetical protein